MEKQAKRSKHGNVHLTRQYQLQRLGCVNQNMWTQKSWLEVELFGVRNHHRFYYLFTLFNCSSFFLWKNYTFLFLLQGSSRLGCLVKSLNSLKLMKNINFCSITQLNFRSLWTENEIQDASRKFLCEVSLSIFFAGTPNWKGQSFAHWM